MREGLEFPLNFSLSQKGCKRKLVAFLFCPLPVPPRGKRAKGWSSMSFGGSVRWVGFCSVCAYRQQVSAVRETHSSKRGFPRSACSGPTRPKTRLKGTLPVCACGFPVCLTADCKNYIIPKKRAIIQNVLLFLPSSTPRRF